jgi:hypothetical protein
MTQAYQFKPHERPAIPGSSFKIDPDQPLADRLRPGMSVVTRIDTSD